MKLVVVATAWSILFYGSVVVSNDATSMEKFIGNWTVHHSDNFEAYLSAKGIPFFMRQMIKLSKIKRRYEVVNKTDDHYECYIDTDNDRIIHWDFKLGAEFENEYLDGKMRNITIGFVDSATLNETHRYADGRADSYALWVDTLTYNAPYLIMEMRYKTGDSFVSTKRFYTKETKSP